MHRAFLAGQERQEGSQENNGKRYVHQKEKNPFPHFQANTQGNRQNSQNSPC